MQINIYDPFAVEYGHISPKLGNYHGKAIEAAALIRGAANYIPFLIGAPKTNQQSIAARGTWRGTAALGQRGYILGISGYASNASGFKLQLKDLGTGRPLFQQPLNFANCTAQPSGTPETRVHYLPRPHLVKDPGVIEIAITSLATAAQDIEIVLHTAQELYSPTEEE